MANTLTDIMSKILARGLLVFRELAVMPRLVNSDFSSEAAEKGDTIDVPISAAIPVRDVVPGPTPPTNVDTAFGKVQIPLDKWKEAPFTLSDKEMAEIDVRTHFLPLQTLEAIRALANQVNVDIHAGYTGIYGFVGSPGVTPFASDVSDAVNARKVLNKQRAPKPSRGGVLDFDAEANALSLAPFSDAEKTGENGVKIEGEIGRKYGIQWAADDAVPTHVAGTLTSLVDVTGANAVGVKSVDLTTDATGVIALLKGDIITFAGDTQTYVVTADLSVGNSSSGPVLIEPGLKIALVGNEVVTVKATHVVNQVFHREAYAFAARPLAQSTEEMALGSGIVTMQDPQTGIPLRLEVSRQHKQVTWSFDILYGTALIRPEGAARIAG